MTMYTTTPLVGTADIHTGFYVILVIAIVVVCSLLLSLYEHTRNAGDWESNTLKPAIRRLINQVVVILIIVVASFVISYTTGTRPMNVPVHATLVKNIESVECKRRYESVPTMFVIYKVPEGEVVLRRNLGDVYPAVAILYKN